MTKREYKRQAEYRRQAEEATMNLRTSGSALMRRLREILTGKEVDPQKTALVGIHVDEVYSHAGGSLVLPNGDAVGFSLTWSDTSIDRAHLSHWFVDNDSPSRVIGRQLLERESGTA